VTNHLTPVQDKQDDMKLGLYSPALLLAENTIPFCTMFSVLFISMVCYGGTQNGHGLPFWIAMMVAGALLLTRLWSTNIDHPEDCKRLFLGTPFVGQIILIGLISDSVCTRVLAGIPL
jgi:4-hydroxybenzoate polyprenyltransferase